MFGKKKVATPPPGMPPASPTPSVEEKGTPQAPPTPFSADGHHDSPKVRFNRSELSEDQTNMAEVALALTSETDVRKLAGIILGKCRLLAHGDRSALFLLDEGTRELVEFAIVRGDGEVELRERGIVRVAIGSGVAGHCAASGNPLNIDDAYGTRGGAGRSTTSSRATERSSCSAARSRRRTRRRCSA